MRPGLASKTPAPKGSRCTGFIFISLTHLHRVVTDGLACLPVHSKPIINRGQLTPRDTWSPPNTGGLFISSLRGRARWVGFSWLRVRPGARGLSESTRTGLGPRRVSWPINRKSIIFVSVGGRTRMTSIGIKEPFVRRCCCLGGRLTRGNQVGTIFGQALSRPFHRL